MADTDKLTEIEDRFNYLAKHIMDLGDIKNRKDGGQLIKYHISNTRTAFDNARKDPTENNILAAQSMGELFTSYAQSMGISEMRLANKDAQRQRADRNEELARVDGLTQLANKSGTTAAVHDMIARSKRDGSAVAVLFIDLTKFKPINDTLGHLHGDKALQLVAEKIKETVRDGDITGRVGGDEFVVAMSNIDPSHDFSAEERKIIDLFDDNIIYHDDNNTPYPIGGDLGIALVAAGETAEAAIERADHLMYKNKQIRHAELAAEQSLETPDI